MYVPVGQSNNISQMCCSCISDVTRRVGFKPANMILWEQKKKERAGYWIRSWSLQFHQQYRLLDSGKDYSSWPRYSLALNTETKQKQIEQHCKQQQFSLSRRASIMFNVWTLKTTCEILTELKLLIYFNPHLSFYCVVEPQIRKRYGAISVI